jgi:sn-glycerol 3-phosphate transport system substrate-binding protein
MIHGRNVMIRRRRLLAASAGIAAGALGAPALLRAQEVKALTFYYPIAVGGPLQSIMDGYCADFAKETGIVVNPVYSGDYGDPRRCWSAFRGTAGG